MLEVYRSPPLMRLHYYRVIYHYHTFTAVAIEATAILAPSVGTIARPPRTKIGSSDFYHRWVNDRCGSGTRVAFPPSHEKPGQLGYTFCSPALK
jgi:hypothetical protein